MQRTEFHFGYLAACAALAAGEAMGFALGALAPLWPLALVALLLVALFGYGGNVRRWPWVAVFLVGLTLAGESESARRDVLRRAELCAGPLTAALRVEGGVREGDAWNSFDSSLDGVAVRPRFYYGSAPCLCPISDVRKLDYTIPFRPEEDTDRGRVSLDGFDDVLRRLVAVAEHLRNIIRAEQDFIVGNDDTQAAESGALHSKILNHDLIPFLYDSFFTQPVHWAWLSSAHTWRYPSGNGQ